MEFRNILAFIMVAEQGSFTLAAKKLGYVQSTVTVQIKQLEVELNLVLFDRIGKNVQLTSDGQNFLKYAYSIMNLMNEAKSYGKEEKDLKGQIRIGTLESLLIWILSKKIHTFYKTYPFITITTKTAPSNELLHSLKQNELDLAFVLGNKIRSNNYVCVWEQPVNMVFVTHPYNEIFLEKEVYLTNLVNYPLILTENSGLYRKTLDDIALQKGMTIQPNFIIDNTSAIIKMLKSNFGISFLPFYTVEEDIKNGELSIVDVKDCNVVLWQQLFYHKDKWITPQIQNIINLIKGDLINGNGLHATIER